MSRSLVLGCLFFLSSVFGGSVEIAWKNNLTITNDDLKGRITVLTSIGSLGSLYSGLSYVSLKYELQKGGVQGDGSASGDGVFGAAYTTLGGPLTTYLTYFDVSANWAGSANPTSADVSAAANLIGAAYLALVEVDDNGNVLSGLRLKTLSWSLSAVSTVPPLKFATFTGTSLASQFGSFSISFTFVATDDAGTLTNGAVVTPKSLQTTINILNYPFTVTTSKLRLIVGLGTASGTASGTIQQVGGWHKLSAGSGKSAVTFDGATHAFIDANGNTKSVTVVSSGAGTATADFDGAGFLAQLTKLSSVQHSLVVDYRFVNITFEQSDNITYDPTLSVGNGNAGSSIRAHAPLVVLASLFAFVFAKVL